ncbi:hypothetical protein NBO_298g0002 [Nosema bombycis CQ1]|uniref:FYR N-terminal domain-containing protein n=1 Tax=Nosema bombycis (strain CQ1 / CVCC 102059) TaxID=578461 RepID=R0KRX2_NOSB1|nr:hypothetical protein NBO_298g0002 [Nosema bombycis CQ1]|eukprot:EOB12952.1 hypothetical protein NBO_298g0002 [Nosema bombycis CQ1]
MENKSFLLKRLEKALILRESLNKTLDQIKEEFINTESHVRTLLPLLYKSKPGLQLNKQNTFPFVPSPHITDFPFFARNSKYILALYNTGLPMKCIIPNPLPLVIYTNGYHSKRMYYKHKCHKDKDDNYIFYTCITRVVNNRLMFEIKTDDGLYILDNKLGAHETMLGLFKRKYEFEDIEDFFGLSSREIIDFIKLKFENK